MNPFSFAGKESTSTRENRGRNYRGNRRGRGSNIMRYFDQEQKPKLDGARFEEIRKDKEWNGGGGKFTHRNNFNYLTLEDLNGMMSMSLENLVTFIQNLKPWRERLDRTHSLGKYIDFLLEILVKICGLENEVIYFVRDFFESSNFSMELNRTLRDVSSILYSPKDMNGVPKILNNLHIIYSTSIKYFRSDLRYFDPKDIIECIELIRDIKKNEGWQGLDLILFRTLILYLREKINLYKLRSSPFRISSPVFRQILPM